ncbi:hypothetical protein ACOBQJ_09180 [Pelotomaculum propionicicum]|uniref:hypothetical protein n=1 Tax=Pelotomaculum propionicicum TaxID=258475 RepID=UPI003B7AD5EC
MKIKNWLASAVVLALLGGVLLVGVPAVKAFAAGNQSGGKAGLGYCLKMGRNFGGMSANLAEFLGISQEDLKAERQSGKSMVQIASEQGVSEQELVDYVIGQRSAQIDQMVSDGKITQEQADQHKQLMTERVKENLNRTDVGTNGSGNGGRGNKAAGAAAGAGMGKGPGNGQANCGAQGVCAGNGRGTGVCLQNNSN